MLRVVCLEQAAHNLLDLARVDVDASAETCHGELVWMVWFCVDLTGANGESGEMGRSRNRSRNRRAENVWSRGLVWMDAKCHVRIIKESGSGV